MVVLYSPNPPFAFFGTEGSTSHFAFAGGYFFAAGCRSGSGLRVSGFTVDSSTAVVPVTSTEKSAPAGTR